MAQSSIEYCFFLLSRMVRWSPRIDATNQVRLQTYLTAYSLKDRIAKNQGGGQWPKLFMRESKRDVCVCGMCLCVCASIKVPGFHLLVRRAVMVTKDPQCPIAIPLG